MSEEKRDLAADLAICEAATKEPWEVDHLYSKNGWNIKRAGFPREQDEVKWKEAYIIGMMFNHSPVEGETGPQDKIDAEFIAAALTAPPAPACDAPVLPRLTKRVGVSEAVYAGESDMSDICTPFVRTGLCKTGVMLHTDGKYGYQRHCNDECVLGKLIDRLACYEDKYSLVAEPASACRCGEYREAVEKPYREFLEGCLCKGEYWSAWCGPRWQPANYVSNCIWEEYCKIRPENKEAAAAALGQEEAK